MSTTFEPSPASEPVSGTGPVPASVSGLGLEPAAPAPGAPRTMRIGEVAELTGTTPRTIRYYEEIGLLSGGPERELGKHRCYSQAVVDRISEIVRLKDLLGLSLEQLSQLLEAETARADIRRKYRETDDPERQRTLLQQSAGHIENQLALVRGRIAELSRLERDLSERAELVRTKLSAL
jgi:DNA-binding transcriptional MerR regulator